MAVRLGPRHPKRATWAVVAAVVAAATATATSEAGPLFDWDSITPSRDLEYHDCDAGYKCARLVLPLDWLNTTDPRTTTIAIKKLPALVPDTDPTFAGTIFTNPGGPGGSGVDFVARLGAHIRATADKPGRRHYEILSFDPRGIGHSSPRADCFPGDVLARDSFTLETRGTWGLERSASSLAYTSALNDAYGRRCEDAESVGGEIMAYVGTPSVARDMVEMLDKIEQLRNKEAEGHGVEERLELKRDEGDVPRLQYIGFSYGTILGNYFASLFPGRVGRLILDGVANSDDYSNGPGWTTNLVDTDEIFATFLSGCFHAGSSVCPLRHDEDVSPADIESRVSSFIKRLDKTPLATRSPSGTAVILTGNDVRKIISAALYSPYRLFKPLSETLHQTLAGNTTLIIQSLTESGVIPAPLQDACVVDNGTSPLAPPQGSDATSAVLCGDGDALTNKSLPWWQKYVAGLLDQSEILGAFWAVHRFACSSWRFRPNWSFKGPFTTPEAASDPLIPGRPAAPILFLSNRLDPVTPLSAARAMAANHPGAAVVVQEALGHCAIATAPSECTDTIVADYLEFGTVPSEETSCEAKCEPWDADCNPYKAGVNSWVDLRPREFPLSV